MHELNNASENWTEECNYWRMWKSMQERIEELKNVIKEWNNLRFEECKNWIEVWELKNATIEKWKNWIDECKIWNEN